jgi:hypothetical protein
MEYLKQERNMIGFIFFTDKNLSVTPKPMLFTLGQQCVSNSCVQLGQNERITRA